MNLNNCLFYIFGIWAYLITDTVSILRGTMAEEKKFSYMVSEQIVGKGHDCGASIIDDHNVLTAAHCVYSPPGQFDKHALDILAGTNNLSHTDSSTVRIKVVAAYVPHEYIPTAVDHIGDIAVLKLQHALPHHLHRLQLPPKSDVDYDHKRAKLTGFGWTSVRVDSSTKERGGNIGNALYYADTEVLSHAECQADYPRARINKNDLCARVKQHREDRPRGACVGDSGGPLVYDKTVIGVLSHTPHGCSERKQAGIYTRVSQFLTFIHDAIHHKVQNHHRDDYHDRKFKWTKLPH